MVMNMSRLLIGSHVNVKAPKMLLGAVEDAISYGASTFMFYTGAPQNTIRKPIATFRLEEAKKLMLENNINLDEVVVHAPYIINLANIKSESVSELAVSFLKQEISRVQEIGCKILVLHPGAHVGLGSEEGIRITSERLNSIFASDNSDVIIALETMSGKGSEVGVNIEEIAAIIEKIENKNRIGICLDTCHLHDGGYDVSNFDEILDRIDSLIGLSFVKVVHINDSKNQQGAHKDRHENLGFGFIGFDNLINIIYNPRLINVPKILETPYVGENEPYKKEIEMIKNKTFNPNLKIELGEREL